MTNGAPRARITARNAKPAAAASGSVRRQLRAIPNNGIGFGALRYLGSPAVRDHLRGNSAGPQIAFNYLGQWDARPLEARGGLYKAAHGSLGQDHDLAARGPHLLEVTGLIFAMALPAPTANTTIMARQLLITPDALRGRLSGALGLVTGGAGAVGPVLGGALVGLVAGDEAVLICAAGMAAITVLVTASPTLRRSARSVSPGGGEAVVAAREHQSSPN